jgi:hypothetical protein
MGLRVNMMRFWIKSEKSEVKRKNAAKPQRKLKLTKKKKRNSLTS